MKNKKVKINKEQLRNLILDGISSEELNSKYDYSNVTNMSFMFYGCSSLKSIPELDTSNVTSMYGMFYGCSNLKNLNPYNFHLYDFSKLENKYLKEKYPEFFI